mgnify:FL=1
MAAGLPPDDFWEQCPPTFNAIMLGAYDRQQMEWEAALFSAYHNAAFARSKRLKPFNQYLKAMRPRDAKAEMETLIAGLKSMASKGFDVRVKELK